MFHLYQSISGRLVAEAARIDKVDRNTVYFNGSRLTFSNEWIYDHEPEVGDYVIRYGSSPNKYGVVTAEFMQSTYVLDGDTDMTTAPFKEYKTTYNNGSNISAALIDKVVGGTIYFDNNQLDFNDRWIQENCPEPGDYLVKKSDRIYGFYVIPAKVMEVCYVSADEEIVEQFCEIITFVEDADAEKCLVYTKTRKLLFDKDWITSHDPKVGDYLIKDKYGYTVGASFVKKLELRNKETIIAELALRIRLDAAELTSTDCSATLIIQLLHTVEALEESRKPYTRAY